MNAGCSKTTIPALCDTRWESYLATTSSIVDLADQIVDWRPANLKHHFDYQQVIGTAKSVRPILQGFATVLRKFEADCFGTIAEVMMTLRNFKEELRHTQEP
jgi:hypothetical protein